MLTDQPHMENFLNTQADGLRTAVEREAGGRWKAPRQLTTEGGQDARWSPDGGEIVYLRNGGLWVIAPEGSAPRLLVDSRDPAVRPVPLLAQWSPDGRTVYYKALDGEGHASLWSVPTGGGSIPANMPGRASGCGAKKRRPL